MQVANRYLRVLSEDVLVVDFWLRREAHLNRAFIRNVHTDIVPNETQKITLVFFEPKLIIWAQHFRLADLQGSLIFEMIVSFRQVRFVL